MLGVIVALVVGLLLLCWVLYTAYLEYVHRKYAHLPRPEPFNFYLGHLLAIAEVTERKRQCLDYLLLEWCGQYGSLFVIFIMHNPVVVTFNPKDYQVLLMSSKANKELKAYHTLACPLGQRFVGYGLVTEPSYDKWETPRRHYDPCFSKKFLKSLLPQINEHVDSLVKRMDARADGKTLIDMATEFGITTLDVVSQLMNSTGIQDAISLVPSQKGKDVAEWLRALHNCFDGVQLALYPHGTVYKYLLPFVTKRYKDSMAMYRQLAESCIMHRMKMLDRGQEGPHDLLERIVQRPTIENGNTKLTLTDLADDFVTLFVAGFETTTVTLGFTVALVLTHPDIFARVLEEVSEVLEERTVVTAEDLERLQYVEQVLQETMRLYPPAPAVQRSYPEDLELGGFKIPKNSCIQISIYGMGRLPSNFEDPERFDPSRFDRRNSRPDSFTYLPFSRGHRMCIGNILAMMEGKMIIARLFQTFRLQLPVGYKVGMEAHLTLRITPPLQLTAERI